MPFCVRSVKEVSVIAQFWQDVRLVLTVTLRRSDKAEGLDGALFPNRRTCQDHAGRPAGIPSN